ncbi:hypothetical protein HMPREF0658_0988 [Hoylesella marshii DSM 16973 = JCM 13450]|uniref:Uncharacterized protein n=1 Tax=Hoylesella marshii DSM 16973 = JCM 13450 TaxID=862515 RepID=E0NS37_9BACT|nr:hypothetical protein HMPREF0658_0988 [Hoylesella marshii DSM 16973 = JCM 13450]
MLLFRRPFGAFSFCACLSGASPLPVFCHLSEVSFYKGIVLKSGNPA